MKCYFREGDGEWVKGYIMTTHSNRIVHLKQDLHLGTYSVELRGAEILFPNDWMIVTGYTQIDENEHALRSFDVSGGWVKPKA